MDILSKPKTIGVTAGNVAYISPRLKPSTDDDIKQASIKLALKLQQTLEIEILLSTFCEEASYIVPCDSVAFRNDELDLFEYFGEKHPHICQYTLEIEEQMLGYIECTRQTPFSETELITLENLLTQLIFPLRNAIMYSKALMLAHKDPLTQISNRTAFDSDLEQEIHRAQRHKIDLCMIMIDIDHFKNINDKFGHLVGDQVLKIVTQKLQQSIRKCDKIYRYGGEEFVILLPNTDILHGRLTAERIRMHLAAEPIKSVEQLLPVTVSLGISKLQSNELGNTLFHRADQALYLAKNKGRNQVCSA